MGREIKFSIAMNKQVSKPMEIPMLKRIIREGSDFTDIDKFIIEIDRYTIIKMTKEVSEIMNRPVDNIPDFLRQLADVSEWVNG